MIKFLFVYVQIEILKRITFALMLVIRTSFLALEKCPVWLNSKFSIHAVHSSMPSITVKHDRDGLEKSVAFLKIIDDERPTRSDEMDFFRVRHNSNHVEDVSTASIDVENGEFFCLVFLI